MPTPDLTPQQVSDMVEEGTRFHEHIRALGFSPAQISGALTWAAGMFLVEYSLASNINPAILIRNFQTSTNDAFAAVAEHVAQAGEAQCPN